MSKRFQKKKPEPTTPPKGKSITVIIPIPKFNLNKRSKNYLFDAGKRKSDVKKAKSACRTTLNKLSENELEELGLPWEKAHFVIDWYHPTSRHKDPWNIIDCLKGTLDGIERAGVIWNDRKIQPPTVNCLTDKSNPRVVITIFKIEE